MATLGADLRSGEDVVDALPGLRLLPFGHEQPGQLVDALSERAPDRSQLVALDGLLDAEPAFQPRHPKPGLRQINMIPAQYHCFRDPQPMSEHHQDQKLVASAIPAELGASKKPVNLWQLR